MERNGILRERSFGDSVSDCSFAELSDSRRHLVLFGAATCDHSLLRRYQGEANANKGNLCKCLAKASRP